MNWPIALVGGLATLGFVLISGWINARFGMSLGRDAADGIVFAIASACADGMKAVLPFVIVAAWRGVRPVMIFASVALWVLCSAYSLTSSLGFAASNRAQVTDARHLDSARYSQLQAALKQKQHQLNQLKVGRSADAIASELAAFQQQKRWRWTRECSHVRGIQSNRFCNRYFSLKANHGDALQAQKLSEEIDRLRQQMLEWKGFAGQQIDPQISVIDQIVGLGADRVTLAITLLLSLMLEVGSGLGFLLVFQKAREESSASNSSPTKKVELMPAESSEASPILWVAASYPFGSTGFATTMAGASRLLALVRAGAHTKHHDTVRIQ